jgi:hypothetical protein
MRFDILTAVNMKVTVFWDDTKLHGVTDRKTVLLCYQIQSDYK